MIKSQGKFESGVMILPNNEEVGTDTPLLRPTRFVTEKAKTNAAAACCSARQFVAAQTACISAVADGNSAFKSTRCQTINRVERNQLTGGQE